MPNRVNEHGEYVPNTTDPEILRRHLTRRRFGAGAGLVVASAAVGDQVWGLVEYDKMPPVEARMLINPGSNTLVHIFGGLATPGISSEEGLGVPIVQNVQRASAVAYSYTGIQHEEEMRLAMRVQTQMQPERTVIIGGSIGVMPAVDLATRIAAAGGHVDVLVADSGCSGPNSARGGFRTAQKADGSANVITRSGLLNYLKPGYVRDNLVPPLDQRQPQMLTEDQFRRYRQGIIDAPLRVIGMQADFMNNFQIEPGVLQGVADRAMYFRTRRPDLDAFVDPLIAINEIQGWFGDQPLEVVIDPTRRDDNHTATGFPGSLVELVGSVANA